LSGNPTNQELTGNQESRVNQTTNRASRFDVLRWCCEAFFSLSETKVSGGLFMSMREVPVYDGDFPTREQILSGDPSAVFPKESWLAQVRPGEFAVRYKDFKTGLARNPAGALVQSSEICRIFSDLKEARADSRKVANEHWAVLCFIYDHTGSQVASVSNNKELGKFAAALYGGIVLWIGIFTIAGMGTLWILYRITLLILKPFSARQQLFVSGWLGWAGFAFAGLLLGILAWYMKVRFTAKRSASRMLNKVRVGLSTKQKKRFAELNTLYGSQDPAERERFLKLASEYQQIVREALKK